MSAINDNALSKFVGILEVAPQATPGSLVRIGSVRGLVSKFDTTKNKVDIKADDTGTVFKGFRGEATIEGSFLENFDRDLIKMLFGGTPADVAASLVSGHSFVVASAKWTYDGFIELDHQNGDGSKPTITSVTGSVDGALVLNTDYFIIQNTAGNWGVAVRDSSTVTTLTQSITIVYSYTPNSAENITIPLTFLEAPRLYVKITATSGGKDRVIILDDATFEGSYDMEFLDVVEAGDIKGTSFVFTGNKGSNLIIQNEIL